jgi:hypothetical protein
MSRISTNKKQFFLIGFIIGIVCVSSCNKHKDETAAPLTPANTPKGTFMFHLHTYIDQDEVDLYGITYATTAGRNISLTQAQMYISEVQLEKLDGSWIDIAGKKLLKTFEADTYVVGDVPVGNYKSIRFKVGLDAATNLLNPTATADSVILNKPAMWYGSTAQPNGYIFLNVQGTIDTSSNMSGAMANFAYKIGTNTNYKQITMPDKNFSVVENQVVFGHIIIDYSLLFTGIQLNHSTNLSVITPADNSNALTTALVNNIPTMFKYEE